LRSRMSARFCCCIMLSHLEAVAVDVSGRDLRGGARKMGVCVLR